MSDEAETKIILEQYKMYVDMADKVSTRRATANQFFITMLVAELAMASFLLNQVKSSNYEAGILAIIGLFGVSLCAIWRRLLQSYRQLNEGKYKVIHQLEQKLPFKCFDVEWDILGRGKKPEIYQSLSEVEGYIPGVLAIPFALLLVMSYFLWRA